MSSLTDDACMWIIEALSACWLYPDVPRENGYEYLGPVKLEVFRKALREVAENFQEDQKLATDDQITAHIILLAIDDHTIRDLILEAALRTRDIDLAQLVPELARLVSGKRHDLHIDTFAYGVYHRYGVLHTHSFLKKCA